MKCFVALVILAVSSSVCHAGEPLTPVMMNERLRIPDNEIPILKKKAKQGDAEAAKRLALYYGTYLDQKEKYLYYLKLGARQNSDVAIQSLMTIYTTDPDFYDFDKALTLRQRLKKMVAEGHQIELAPDAEWAYDLYIDHFVGYGNKKRGLFFLELAAKHGSEKARNELIEIYSNDPDVRNPAKARHWKQAKG